MCCTARSATAGRVRDERFGVLATSPLSVHQALMVSQWSNDVTLFLHTVAEEELPDDDLRRLAAAGVKVVPGEVAGLRVEDDRLTGVLLADGTAHDRSVVFVAPKAAPQTGLMERLGAELQETPFGAYPRRGPDGPDHVPGVDREAARWGSPSRSSTRRAAATARRRPSSAT